MASLKKHKSLISSRTLLVAFYIFVTAGVAACSNFTHPLTGPEIRMGMESAKVTGFLGQPDYVQHLNNRGKMVAYEGLITRDIVETGFANARRIMFVGGIAGRTKYNPMTGRPGTYGEANDRSAIGEMPGQKTYNLRLYFDPYGEVSDIRYNRVFDTEQGADYIYYR